MNLGAARMVTPDRRGPGSGPGDQDRGVIGASAVLSALEVVPDNGSQFILYGSATVAAIRRDADGWRLYERSWPRFAPRNPTQLLDAEDEHDALIDALELTAAPR